MEYFTAEAVKEALKSPMSKKYGAVLIHKGKIISRGYNYDTCPSSTNKCCLLCG